MQTLLLHNSYSFYVPNFALVEELVLVAQLQRRRWKQLVELFKDDFFQMAQKCIMKTALANLQYKG